MQVAYPATNPYTLGVRSSESDQNSDQDKDMSPFAIRFLRLVVPLVLVALAATWAEACPTCKQALAHDPNGAEMARGFAYSILFMLSVPYLIFAGLGSYLYWLVKRSRPQRTPLSPVQTA